MQKNGSHKTNVPQTVKTRVFMSGRSQHVTIPAEYRFGSTQVAVHRDAATGALVLTEVPNLKDVFAALDATRDERIALSEDRDQSLPVARPGLERL